MSRDVKDAKLCDSVSSSSSTCKPEPILGLELTEEIPLEKVYVGIIKDKRNISKAIQLISTASPGFGHLKRCSDVRLLLSRVTVSGSCQQLKDDLKSKGFDLSILAEQFEVSEVPSKPCKTKKQAEINSKIWPLNFHPDPITESILSGDIFSEEILTRIKSLMRIAIDATRIESIGNSECNGSALIVDPSSGECLALASSQHQKNPLWHASMLAIDLVSKIQGGGSWDLIKTEKCENQKRKLQENYPLRYPESLDRIRNFPKPEPLEFRTKLNNKKQVKNEDKDSSKTGPYLCTNFWIFLIQEPCTLCAMALLHSRASKIFYGLKNINGVLGSKALLHTTPGLNHRYQVWRGVLENECKIVSDEIKVHQLE